MPTYSYYLFLIVFTALACQPTTSEQTSAANVSNTVDTMPSQAADTPPPSAQALPQAAEKSALTAFGKPTMLKLPELSQLCQNKYGCLQESIYPFGWSEDGKFAYLLARTNEAVNNYTLDFFIQDMTNNTTVATLQYQASKQPGYTEDSDAYNFDAAWETKAKDFRELVDANDIIPFSGTELLAPQALGLTLATQDERKLSNYTGKEVIAKHQLHLTTQKAKRTIVAREYGKYDLILGTEVLGIFTAPNGQYHALLEAEEQRGFEGPPNVLKLQLTGF